MCTPSWPDPPEVRSSPPPSPPPPNPDTGGLGYRTVARAWAWASGWVPRRRRRWSWWSCRSGISPSMALAFKYSNWRCSTDVVNAHLVNQTLTLFCGYPVPVRNWPRPVGGAGDGRDRLHVTVFLNSFSVAFLFNASVRSSTLAFPLAVQRVVKLMTTEDRSRRADRAHSYSVLSTESGYQAGPPKGPPL
jgi:hypothetical protein